MPSPVVLDRRRLAVHDALGAHDLAAECLADGLMAEADAEDRAPSPASSRDELEADAASVRRAGPGRDTDRLGREPHASADIASLTHDLARVTEHLEDTGRGCR